MAAPNDQKVRIFRQTVVVAACLVISLGLAMVGAWLTGAASLGSLPPGVFHMKFNTSLAFIASGVGLVATLWGSRWIALAAGSLVLLISGLTLLQYLSGIDLGIDQWCVRDYQPDILHPGRIAPNTALAFICFAISTNLEIKNLWWRAAILNLAGGVVLALGATGWIGYFFNTGADFAWGSATPMAPSTAMGIMVLGVGLVAFARSQQDIFIAHAPLWLLGLFLAIFVVDSSMPRGLLVDVAYIPLILLSMRFAHSLWAFELPPWRPC